MSGSETVASVLSGTLVTSDQSSATSAVAIFASPPMGRFTLPPCST
jgi:hypothetical protein